MGPSPLEDNVKQLGQSGAATDARIAAWAVKAFRQAHADEVHTEGFSVQRGDLPGLANGTRSPDSVEGENVVAEIRGRDASRDFVLVGAPLPYSRRRNDASSDACDPAVIVDALRTIQASGAIARQPIRFVLFGGQEQGIPGSWAYLQKHQDELNNMTAAVFYDEGCRPIEGYSLTGRDDILPAVREVLAPIRPLDASDLTLDAEKLSANLYFVLEGIPTLVARGTPGSAKNNYANADSVQNLNIKMLKNNVAIATITAFALADDKERIGRRESRAQAEQLLKTTGLDRSMQLAEWPSGEKGSRSEKP